MIKTLKNERTQESVYPNIVNDNIPDNTITENKLDSVLANKINNKYTKTETDNLLDQKADKSTTYTKTETDGLLNLKADKSTTYTKTEIDNVVSGLENSIRATDLVVNQIESGKLNIPLVVDGLSDTGVISSSDLTKIINSKSVVLKRNDEYFYNANTEVNGVTEIIFASNIKITRMNNTYSKLSQDIIAVNYSSGAWLYTENAIVNTYTNTDIDNLLGGKLNTPIELTGSSGTLTSTELTNILTTNYLFVKVDGSYFYKQYENSTTITLVSRETFISTSQFNKEYLTITKSSGAWVKTTDLESSLFPNKQDELVSGTNIKTINNQSLLGSGNISVGSTQKYEHNICFKNWQGNDNSTLQTTSVNSMISFKFISTSNTQIFNLSDLLLALKNVFGEYTQTTICASGNLDFYINGARPLQDIPISQVLIDTSNEIVKIVYWSRELDTFSSMTYTFTDNSAIFNDSVISL